jgi:hypothetical protein
MLEMNATIQKMPMLSRVPFQMSSARLRGSVGRV